MQASTSKLSNLGYLLNTIIYCAWLTINNIIIIIIINLYFRLAVHTQHNKHIATVTSKPNKALGFVKRNIHSSSELVKTRAYQAIVRPSLEYATCVWDPRTQIAKQKLDAVQRRAARYVTRRYHNTSSVTNMLRHLEWQTLDQRRIATNLTMLYKITNNIVTVPIHTYLTPWTRPPHVHTISATCHTNVTQILSNIASFHAPSFYGIHCHLTQHLPHSVYLDKHHQSSCSLILHRRTPARFSSTILLGTSLCHHLHHHLTVYYHYNLKKSLFLSTFIDVSLFILFIYFHRW